MDFIPCPCCGAEEDGGLQEMDDICHVCWWHYEGGFEYHNMDEVSGPNHVTLNEARANFAKYGACCPHGYWCKHGTYPIGYMPEEDL